MRNVWHAGLVIAALVALPEHASAYRTAAEDSDVPAVTPVAWTGAIRVAIASAPPRGVSAPDATGAVDLAVAAWRAAACGTLNLSSSLATGTAAVQGDGLVSVEPLGDRWTSVGYPADVPARTEITFRESEGAWRIADADIYLNDAAFDFALAPAGAQVDLVAIMTHELGHALGLAHNCAAPGSGERAPACDSAPHFVEATMYPTYLGASQRVVGADDADGLCFLYPSSAPTGCEVTGCTVGYLCEASVCVRDPSIDLCTSEADCDGFERCIGSICAAGVGAIGDPCVDPQECGAGVCSTAGRCARMCDAGSPCPTNYECRGGVCTTALGELDEPCTVGEACASNYCLAGARVEPVCTRLCDSSTPCPLGWTCGELEGRVVCIPMARQSGCTATSNRRASPLPAVCLLAFVALALRRKT